MLQLYKNIKSKRKELGMTQGELAEKMGYADKSMIAKIESGQVDLPTSKILAFAAVMGIDAGDLMGADGTNTRKIPLYGSVAAGSPLEMIPVYDYIDDDYSNEEYFALTIRGNSMDPDIQDGDIAIVHRQDVAENGSLVIATIDGESATCKTLKILSDGIELIPHNSDYAPFTFTAEQVEKMPVRILGKVVETRRSW